MHLRLQPRLQPEAATRGCNRTHLRLQPHAPQVCRGAARLLRRGVLAARRRVLAAAQRLEPRPAAWPAHSGRPAARRRSLQRALAAGVAGWGRLRVPVGAACAPRATELLPAAASERRGRQPRHAPPWLSGAVASALAIRRASGASWSCRAPEGAALLAGAPARWKWPPRCATAWKPHASRTGLCSGTGLLCVVASRARSARIAARPRCRGATLQYIPQLKAFARATPQAHVQLESRRLAGTLPLHAFPLSCTSTALPTAQQQAIEALWSSLSPAETPVQSRGEGLPAAVNGATAPVGAAQPAALWPLDDEVCGSHASEAATPMHRRLQPHTSDAATPMHRRLQPPCTGGCNRIHRRLQPPCSAGVRRARNDVFEARRRQRVGAAVQPGAAAAP